MSLIHSLFLPFDNNGESRRPVVDRLREGLDEGVLAESLGFDAVYCAEHHLSEYGLVPNPAVFLAHLAARTRRIRLGPAIANLNARSPLATAEDYALLDQLSGGRLVMGVGAGYVPDELATFGVDEVSRHGRFAERLATVRRLLGGRIASHAEPGCLIKREAIPVSTCQAFGPPLALASFSAEAAFGIGAEGLALWLMPHASCEHRGMLEEMIAAHREGFVSRLRHHPSAVAEFAVPRVAVCMPAYIASDLPTALRFAGGFLRGHLSRRHYPRRMPVERLVEEGLTLIGGPGQIRRTLAWLAECGVTEVMSMHAFGGMPSVHVQASMRALAQRIALTMDEIRS